MKKLLTPFAAAALLATTALPAAASTEQPAPASVSSGRYEPLAGLYTEAENLGTSDHRVVVATKRGGKGDRITLRPGQATEVDIDSVYIHYVRGPRSTCATYLNGDLYAEQGWVNTAWWRWVRVEIDCW